MRIQFLPRYRTSGTTHVLTDTHWQYGEVKDLDPFEKIRLRRGNDYEYVYVVDNLLENPDFIVEDLGHNPNFICSKCNQATYETAVFHPRTGATIPLTIEGDRVCSTCFWATPHKVLPFTIEFNTSD